MTYIFASMVHSLCFFKIKTTISSDNFIKAIYANYAKKLYFCYCPGGSPEVFKAWVFLLYNAIPFTKSIAR